MEMWTRGRKTHGRSTGDCDGAADRTIRSHDEPGPKANANKAPEAKPASTPPTPESTLSALFETAQRPRLIHLSTRQFVKSDMALNEMEKQRSETCAPILS